MTAKRIGVYSIWEARCEFALGWLPKNITNDNSILVQLMV